MPLKVQNRKKLKVAVYCLLTAGTFWFFNALGNQYSTDINFPVEYELSDGLILKKSSDHIFVLVSGTGWNIINHQIGFNTQPIVIKFDKEGKYFIQSKDYTSFIRGELDNVEIKQFHTDSFTCVVTKNK